MSRDRQRLIRGLEGVRTVTAQAWQQALARARATAGEVELDMELDYGAAPPHAGVRREGLDALRRHLQHTLELLPHLSNLDDPEWLSAQEAYQRSWDEVVRAFEGAAGARGEHT